MSFLDSVISDLADPLTGLFQAATTSDSQAEVTLTDASDASASTSTSSRSIVSISPTTKASSTGSATRRTATSTSSDDSTQTDDSSSTSSSVVTMTTITVAASRTSSSSSSTTILPAPVNPISSEPTGQSAPTETQDAEDQVSVAGIVLAVIAGLLFLAIIGFLIFRYCGPVRRRYLVWSAARLKQRTYREALDGPLPFQNGPKQEKELPPPPQERLSFFGKLKPPGRSDDKRTSHGLGLGLGPVSGLRVHSFGHRNRSTPVLELDSMGRETQPASQQPGLRVAVQDLPRSEGRLTPAVPTPAERVSQIGLAVSLDNNRSTHSLSNRRQ